MRKIFYGKGRKFTAKSAKLLLMNNRQPRSTCFTLRKTLRTLWLIFEDTPNKKSVSWDTLLRKFFCRKGRKFTAKSAKLLLMNNRQPRSTCFTLRKTLRTLWLIFEDTPNKKSVSWDTLLRKFFCRKGRKFTAKSAKLLLMNNRQPRSTCFTLRKTLRTLWLFLKTPQNKKACQLGHTSAQFFFTAKAQRFTAKLLLMNSRQPLSTSFTLRTLWLIFEDTPK